MAILETGTSVRRLEDRRFLTGEGRFAADLDRDGQLHAVIVRSIHAHAGIRHIDIDAAAGMRGVVGVHVESDLAADGIGTLPCVSQFEAVTPLVKPPRRALARGRVRHVGDPVALVVAETHEEAVAAAECVVVDYDPLASVVDSLATLGDDAPQIWPEAPGNIAFRFQKGDQAATEAAFATAAHVVELDIVNNRISAAPLEPRAGIGEFDPSTETFTLTCSAQGVHTIRRQLAGAIFNLPEANVTVAAPDVGGGFGLKNFLYPEWILLLWAARRHGRPIKWIAERGEDLSAAAHGRDIRTQARLALDADGNFLALEADLVANMGAYLSGAGPNASTTASPTAMGGIYRIPNIFMQSCGVFTNTVPVDAYRGAGKPEANFIIERLIEVAARRCGFDPVALRLRNAISAFPHRTALGQTLDCGKFGQNIEDAVRRADRAGFERRRSASREAGKLRGMGVSCFLETSRGAPQEGAEIRFSEDGQIELLVGTESNGQGHETAYKQIASERLGVPMEMLSYVQADTRLTRTGFGHGGARSMHMGGGAMVRAIEAALEKARSVAAQLLQAEPDALSFSSGRFSTVSDGRSVGLMDVAAAARTPALAPDESGAGLDSFVFNENMPFTFPNGCHVAEIEIDPDTGLLALLRYVAVDDYGTLVNPMLTEGQVHGGLAQGIGQAVGEHAVYDQGSGQLLAGSMMDYFLPRATHLPALEVTLDGIPTKANPLGVKGSGQAGCIAAPQTIVNAVLDALAPLGIDHIQMPVTSEAIWNAIRAARTA